MESESERARKRKEKKRKEKRKKMRTGAKEGPSNVGDCIIGADVGAGVDVGGGMGWSSKKRKEELDLHEKNKMKRFQVVDQTPGVVGQRVQRD